MNFYVSKIQTTDSMIMPPFSLISFNNEYDNTIHIIIAWYNFNWFD